MQAQACVVPAGEATALQTSEGPLLLSRPSSKKRRMVRVCSGNITRPRANKPQCASHLLSSWSLLWALLNLLLVMKRRSSSHHVSSCEQFGVLPSVAAQCSLPARSRCAGLYMSRAIAMLLVALRPSDMAVCASIKSAPTAAQEGQARGHAD